MIANGTAHVFPNPETDVPEFIRALAVVDRHLTANHDPQIGPFLSRYARGEKVRLDIDKECGYFDDTELDAVYYKKVYSRWNIAARYVNIWPDESWAAFPTVSDNADPGSSSWDRAFADLDKEKNVLSYCHRVDRLSRICNYGVLYLGYDDGGQLNRPPAGVDPNTGERKGTGANRQYKLNFIRAFDQTLVRVVQTEQDPANARFGQPKMYAVQFVSPSVAGPNAPQPGFTPAPSGSGPTLKESHVHWTRMIHVADNRRNSEVYGVPALLAVMNILYDLRKVVGGSAEMFWKGGFPGYAFKTYPELAGETLNADSLREAMRKYQAGLERYLATIGGEWVSLQPQVANPSNHIDWYIKLLCATDAIPTKIFLGSESGQLAATKDDENWRTRLAGRQQRYVEPFLLRPLIDRLILMGCLPKPQRKNVNVTWRDLRTLSEADRADIALKKIQSLQTYYASDCDQRFPNKLMLTLIMGFTEDQADLIVKELEKSPPPKKTLSELTQPPQPVTPFGGGAKNPLPFGGGAKKPLQPGGTRKVATKPKGRPTGKIEGKTKSAKKSSGGRPNPRTN